MKQKLFENVGGNSFKLITESIDEVNPNTKHVREGLKKVFGAGSKSLSYKRLQGVGLGYIKSVSEAQKTAIQEARILAKEYGYTDNENSQQFVKEFQRADGTDTSNPPHDYGSVKNNSAETGANHEESREVQIGKEILAITNKYGLRTSSNDLPEETSKAGFDAIGKLAQELIQLHGQ